MDGHLDLAENSTNFERDQAVPVAALYALKAVRSAGGKPDAERAWQDKRLPLEIRELVLGVRERRKA